MRKYEQPRSVILYVLSISTHFLSKFGGTLIRWVLHHRRFFRKRSLFFKIKILYFSTSFLNFHLNVRERNWWQESNPTRFIANAIQFSQLTLFIKESDYFYGNFNFRLWYWLLATDPNLPGRKDDGVDLFHRDVKILRQSCAFSLFYKQMFLLVNCYIKSFFTLDLKKSSLFYNKIKYI